MQLLLLLLFLSPFCFCFSLNEFCHREKVLVPSTKPYISFISKGSSETVIAWNSQASDLLSNGQTIGTLNSASVAVEADYFCANGITFKVLNNCRN